jgi:predicted DNA-binding ArsR family transcriptional regulator
MTSEVLRSSSLLATHVIMTKIRMHQRILYLPTQWILRNSGQHPQKGFSTKLTHLSKACSIGADSTSRFKKDVSD